MDILSHGLWGMLAAQAVNVKHPKLIKSGWAFLWGVFPDAFAFGAPFIFLIALVLSGDVSLSDWGARGPEAMSQAVPLFNLSPILYQFSHSFVIMGLVAGAYYLIRRRLPWPMIGWGMHILFDIPTHDIRFYPTPFLWPLSNVRIDGFSWGQGWFLILNYSLLAIGFLTVYLLRRRVKKIK